MSKQTNTETETKTNTAAATKEPTEAELAKLPDPALVAAQATKDAAEKEAGLIGGPGDSLETKTDEVITPAAPAAPVVTATANANATTPSVDPKLSFAGGEVEVVEETVSTADSTTPETPDSLQKFLTDPDQFAADIKNNILLELANKDEVKKKTDSAWESVYAANPDMNNQRLLVDAARTQIISENGNALNALPFQRVADLIIARAREIRKTLNPLDDNATIVDTTTTTSVVSSSGNPAPRIAVTKPVPMTMMDQMRAHQAPKKIVV